jgi:hypothetical protein
MGITFTNTLALLTTLFITGILYHRVEAKRLREQALSESETEQQIRAKYTMTSQTLAKSKLPILWVHIPYKLNDRNWDSFGSRTSRELNQPYLHLTVKSIIAQCSKSFTICMVDDTSFETLLPEWRVNLREVAEPISDNIRQLCMMKLLHAYGGIVCPISFACLRDLSEMYETGTKNNSLFVCELNNIRPHIFTGNSAPTITFCGAPKDNSRVGELIRFMEIAISKDQSAETNFNDIYGRWVNNVSATDSNIQSINRIDGVQIGVKTADRKEIQLHDLMSNQYLDIDSEAYGILIPSDKILASHEYRRFAKMTEKQVLESDMAIGKYMLLACGEYCFEQTGSTNGV